MNLLKLLCILFLPALDLLLTTACSKPQPASQTSAVVQKPEKPVYFKVDQASAATLTGKVTYRGSRQARKKVDFDEDPECGRLHGSAFYDESVAVSRNGALANVFIYVKEGLQGKQFEPSPDAAVIDQRGCWFYPRVLGIQTGQELKVTNSDPVTHNIHPRAHVNREWNHSQAGGDPPIERQFSQPEIMIRVKCNIHSWMHSWIGVVANPYFAVTGPDGSFVLKNLPAGDYTIEAWQEVLGTQEQHLTLAPSAKQNVTFEFKGQS